MMIKIYNWIKNKAKIIIGFVVTIVLGGVVLAIIIPASIPLPSDTSFESLSDIEKIRDDHFKIKYNESEIEIGNLDSIDFEPIVTMWKWNRENYLTIKYPTNKKIKPKQENGKLKWQDTDIEFYYSKDDEDFKIEVIFNRKPNTNQYSFELDGWEEYDFAYQTPLPNPTVFMRDGEEWLYQDTIQGDLATDFERPRKVDGSYAIYHKTKKDHVEGQTNYRTGLFGYIYVPKATDATGKSEWCSLNYKDGRYTVTIPQKFLDNATYPVILNDQLGNTNVEASSASFGDIWVGLRATATANGTATDIYLAADNVDDYTLALYDQTDDSWMADTAEATSTKDTFIQYALDSVSDDRTLVNGTTYYIVVGDNPVGSSRYNYALFANEGAYTNNHVYTAGDFSGIDPITWDSETYGRRFSMYVEYTPSAGVRRDIQIE